MSRNRRKNTMKLPVLAIDTVYHLGTLNPDHRGMQGGAKGGDSQEGHLLSVSTCPTAWRSIARLGGNDLHALSLPNDAEALFFDILALYDDEYRELRQHIEAFGHEEGLTETVERWRMWAFDDESGDGEGNDEDCWRYSMFETREEALNEVMEEGYDPETTPSAVGHFEVEKFTVMTGTKKLEALVNCKLNNQACLDMLTMVWLEQTILPLQKDTASDQPAKPTKDHSAGQTRLTGVWWQENYDPYSLSAPRGGIFPACLPLFTASLSQNVQDEPDAPQPDTMEVLSSLENMRRPGVKM